MKSRERERRDPPHHYVEEEKLRGDPSRDRDSHRFKDEWDARESYKSKEKERESIKERDGSRIFEEKTSGRDKERHGHRGRDEKEERDGSKRKDERDIVREREHHRSRDGREAAKDKEGSKTRDEKDKKDRDEKDHIVKDDRDSRSRKDVKLKEAPKDRESRWSREEKHTGKEDRSKENDSKRRDEQEWDSRGGKSREDGTGGRESKENDFKRRDEQASDSRGGKTREDGIGGRDSYLEYDGRSSESRQKRKDLDAEERRDRGEKRKDLDSEERRDRSEKRKRVEEDGLERANVMEKREERGEKRKRVLGEEGVAKDSAISSVSEKGQSSRKSPIHDGQPGASSISTPGHLPPQAVNNGGFPTTMRGQVMETAVFSTPSNGGINRSEDVNLSKEGNAAQALKGSNLSTPEALAKAKRALEVQKQLSEKLKKLPQISKPASQSTVASSTVAAVISSSAAPAAVAPLSAGSAVGQMPNVPDTSISSAESMPTNANMLGPGFGFAPGPNLSGLISGMGPVPNYEALKRVQEFAARLGIQQVPLPLLGMVPGQVTDDFGTAGQQKTMKAPVLRLDAHGREIDEHGNVVDRPKVTNLSTLKVNINKQKKEAFQILRPELEEDPVSNPFFDPRMGIDKKKILRPKRTTFQFVEEGRWSKQAEMLRLKSQFGEAQAKEIKMKQAALAKAKAEADINPNLIEVSERVPVKEEKSKDPVPDVEWWDAVLLPSGSYRDVTEGELKVKMEKLTIYVEHPVPIEPPAEPPPPPPQPLKLTKKEQKKLRTQRRLAKEKDRQEMIRQGLLEPPKPKVKMSNLMKVLGAEATQDPTRLEMEIRTAAAEREQAHTDRNLARKLTPAERREKKEKKLFDDPNTLETIVSVYRVNDLSHPQTRFKVDINAQENRLTGCIVMCDTMSVVIVEGGSKSIKRYAKLMLRRINWAAAVKEDEEADDEGNRVVNKCVLVWQGSVAKASFNKFLIQQSRTEAAARKYLADAGVGHYWDLAANFVDE